MQNLVRRFLLPGFWALGAAGAFCLVCAFYIKHTEFFTQVGLNDPSRSESPAGRVFGGLICSILCLSCSWGSYLAWKYILRESDALDQLRKAWEEVQRKWSPESRRQLETDSPQARAIFEKLLRLPTGSMARAVVDSWNDPSPDTDAALVLDSVSSPCRNGLGFLHAVGSVLVLVGLVGNFFGLARAAELLPKLSISSPSVAASVQTLPATPPTPVPAVTSRPAPDVIPISVPVPSPEQSGLVPTSDEAQKAIKGISEGLSVVVVSSVMGIGSMVFLMLGTAWLQGVFHEILDEENRLLAGEFAPIFNPGSAGASQSEVLRGLAAEVAQLRSILQPLPSSLEKFDEVARHLSSAHSSVGPVMETVNTALKRALELTDKAHDDYAGSTRDFREYLEGRIETLNLVAESSVGTSRALADSAGLLRQISEDVARSMQSHERIQVDYENYARLVNTVLNEDREAARQSFETLAERLTDQTRKCLEPLVGKLMEAVLQGQGAQNHLVAQLRQVQEDHRSSLESSSRQSNAQSKQLHEELLLNMGEAQRFWQDSFDQRADAQGKQTEELARQTESGLKSLLTAQHEQALKVLHEQQRQGSEILKKVDDNLSSLLEGQRESQQRSLDLQIKRQEDLLQKVDEQLKSVAKAYQKSTSLGLEAQQVHFRELLARIEDLSQKCSVALEEMRGSIPGLLDSARNTLQPLVLEISTAVKEQRDSGRSLSASADGQVKSLEALLPAFRENQLKLLKIHDRINDAMEFRGDELFETWSQRFSQSLDMPRMLDRLAEQNEALQNQLSSLSGTISKIFETLRKAVEESAPT